MSDDEFRIYELKKAELDVWMKKAQLFVTLIALYGEEEAVNHPIYADILDGKGY